MKILGIIPARYASTRFPGKPLIDLAGKSMIQRVYEQAKKANSLADVVVATDDDRIFNAVKAFKGNVIMTSDKHQSGTDRCAEVSKKMIGFDAIVNIQGDEPLIDPKQINLLASCFNDISTELATLVKKIETSEELFNYNTPKVIINKKTEAIYFSRQVIPYLKNVETKNLLKTQTYYKHIGIYGYRTTTLGIIAKLPISTLEKAEMLEQLRWIENGYTIKVAITKKESLAIDIPEDVQKVLAVLKTKKN
ncbi:MAG: 3-deoxy-manno-octulosonate cytidylyltransferase [Bacteroidetes bacterium]|nr:3-deoxy-manno-octulosonate cytidylyltransferase [Bacteroidota bacterium]MBU1484995.1 3-deoxy-manno-octulosonate cytidylyltransferase [Bacteroidota bacterium]MBU2266976.1 3-deoxy-manno-octulosonate cytidylyltransferase [Bacteroidota bacterium]MBU2375186.1 3-deoxy-manno-octulosonate cytidylyltransferase [Bacteroidota bacterium]